MKNSVLYLAYGSLVIILVGSLDDQNTHLACALGIIFLVPVIMGLVTGTTIGGTGIVHRKKDSGLFWSAMAIWILVFLIIVYYVVTTTDLLSTNQVNPLFNN